MKSVNKYKKSSPIINVLRFIIVGLAIIIQSAISFIVFYKLNEQFLWLQILNFILGITLFLFIVNKDEPAVYKIPWIVLFMAFPIVSVIIYLTFGGLKLSKKTVSKITEVYTANANDLKNTKDALNYLKSVNQTVYGQAKYLVTASNATAYKGSYIKYLNSGEAFFNELLIELNKAEKYIFLEYFIIEEGYMLSKILNVLKEKISQGVNVYLSYDDVGSMARVDNGYAKKLQKIGVKAVKFNAFVPIVSVIHNNRDHRKITVIDGVTAFTGGVNIADEYIGKVKPLGNWKDACVLVKGEAVNEFVKAFCQLYNFNGNEKLNPNDFISKTHEVYAGGGVIIPFTDGPKPIYKLPIGETAYLNLINQATKSLRITTPYLVVDNVIIDALINASFRGVDVKIILPEIPDKKIVSVLTRSNYEKLIAGGVKVYEYKGGFIHSKMVISDNAMIIGTINFDYRSFIHHFENAVYTTCESCLNSATLDFNYMVENECVLITKQKAKQSTVSKLIKGVLTVFSPLF